MSHLFYRKLNQHKRSVLAASEAKKDAAKRRAPPPPTRCAGMKHYHVQFFVALLVGVVVIGNAIGAGGMVFDS